MTAEPSGTRRPLGRIETALTLSNEHWPMNMVAVVHLTPAPDPGLLRTAFDHARRRHPALRAGILPKRGKYEFVYDAAPSVPLTVVDSTDPGGWITATETGLNTSVATTTGPLVAATLIRQPDAADLVVTIHHAVVDATSGANLLAEVLTTYGALASGRVPPEQAALAVPAAADDSFPPESRGLRLGLRGAGFALRSMGPEIRYRLAMRRAGGPHVDPKGRSQIRCATLGTDASAALNRAARRRRITLASTIQAAALSTVHRLRYDARPVPLRTFSFPDLRPFLDPPVPPEPLACYMTMTWQDVTMNRERDLWGLAADVQQRVDTAVRGGAKFTASALTIPLMRMTMATKKLRMGNVAVSHTGATGLAGRYGPLQVGDLRAFVSNLAVGPELSLRTGLFQGRLTLDAQTLDTDMDRAELGRLTDGVVAALEAAAGR